MRLFDFFFLDLKKKFLLLMTDYVTEKFSYRLILFFFIWFFFFFLGYFLEIVIYNDMFMLINMNWLFFKEWTILWWIRNS